MRVALALAPYYVAGSSPPLGLARVATELRQLGHEPVVYDLDFEFAASEPDRYRRFRRAFDIASDLPAVTFVVKPDVVLYDLFRAEYDRAGIMPVRDDHLQDVPILHDALVRFEPWIERLAAESPAAVLFSTFASNMAATIGLAGRIRERMPEVPILFGGPGSGLPEIHPLLLRLRLADAIVVGEGEETVRELFSGASLRPFDGMAGLATRGGCRPRPLIQDLDTLADASFDGFPLPDRTPADYASRGTELRLPVEGTRGCPLKCAFCSETVYWERFRKRSPARIADEIQGHVARTGARSFAFTDSLLNGHGPWLEELCGEIARRDLDIRWCTEMRPVENLTPELCRLLRDAGCNAVSLGVETFHKKFRDVVGKHTSDEEIRSSIDNLAAAGIRANPHLLVGFPGETIDDVLATVARIAEWEKGREGGDVYWGPADVLRVEPYAALFRTPERFGIRLRPQEIPLPPGREDLAEDLSRILWTWEDGVAVEEKHFRARLLRSARELIRDA